MQTLTCWCQSLVQKYPCGALRNLTHKDVFEVFRSEEALGSVVPTVYIKPVVPGWVLHVSRSSMPRLGSPEASLVWNYT